MVLKIISTWSYKLQVAYINFLCDSRLKYDYPNANNVREKRKLG